MTEEFFKIREGIATYLCRKGKDGCWIIAQLGKSGRWIKFRTPQYWKWFRFAEKWTDDPEVAYLSREPETEPVSQEEVTAILLMGKNEKEI